MNSGHVEFGKGLGCFMLLQTGLLLGVEVHADVVARLWSTLELGGAGGIDPFIKWEVSFEVFFIPFFTMGVFFHW